MWQKRFLLYGGWVVALVAVVFLFSYRHQSSPASQPAWGNATNGQSDTHGLTREQLAISAHTLSTHWIESDIVSNDEDGCSGTCFVVHSADQKLYLTTNCHVLYLSELANADSTGGPEVSAYELVVTFASGAERKVRRFGEALSTLDISMLEVDATGLQEGIDYVVVVPGDPTSVVQGDEVVAVGTPLDTDFKGTQTFGKVSALREFDKWKEFQIDAPIWHGNSGGPLFLKSNDRYTWIGVNTRGPAEQLNFAVDARHVWEADYVWYDATASGAQQAINDLYQ